MMRRGLLRRLLLQLPPVLDDVRAIAVYLEPGERFVEDRAVQQCALGAERRLDLDQPVLQAEDLLQALDVAAGNRQQPELEAALQRIRGEALPPPDQAERLQHRAGQNRVGERVRRAFESRPVSVE